MKNKNEEVFEFTCKVEFEIYYNNTWGVYNVSSYKELPGTSVQKDFDTNEDIYPTQLVGSMQQLVVGTKYKVAATKVYSEKYSKWQYQPKTIISLKPTTYKENESFLKTILTENQTYNLLKAYPDIINRIMNNEEINVKNIKGIGISALEKIKEKVTKNYKMSSLLTLLQPLNVSDKAILKIATLDKNPEVVKEKVLNDPYIITEVSGMGFKSTDKIAVRLNPDSICSMGRLNSYLKYFFKQLGEIEGDTICSVSALKKKIANDIPECLDLFDKKIEDTKNGKASIIKVDKVKSKGKEIEIVGLTSNYKKELEILKRLNEIQKYSNVYELKEDDFNKVLKFSEDKAGFEYTDEQINFAKSVFSNGVTLLKANAGAGKTSCVRLLLDMLGSRPVAMCSLSAKAARRMEESTGRPASTIHKLLGFGSKKTTMKEQKFDYDEYNKLPFDVVIVDECSMNNIDIFLALIKAIKETSKLVLVFDDGQLPPIGAGNTATDLLQSKYNVRLLTKVHRQAEDSGILMDANIIRQNKNPLNDLENFPLMLLRGINKDLCYIFRNDPENLRDMAVKQFVKWQEQVGLEETIILVPRKKACVNSALEINKIIQDKLIPESNNFIDRKDCVFKVGCRIINKQNDSTFNIINGEVGYLTNIYTKTLKEEGKEKKQKVFVFTKDTDKDNPVELPIKKIKDFELGYALTVHSAQGSQYKRVINIIDMSHYNLLSSNMLYTMLTRAEDKCLLLAQPKAFQMSINTKKTARKTWTKKILKSFKKTIDNK